MRRLYLGQTMALHLKKKKSVSIGGYFGKI